MFDGKVALVTGAASGIGRATAEALSQRGADVVVLDRAARALDQTAKAITKAGGRALAIRTDVMQADQVEQAVKQAVEQFGRLDIAINSAGVYVPIGPVHLTSATNWNRTIGVNLTGVFYCMKYELTQMVEQDAGVVVNVASAASLVGVEGSCAYAASKHGVLGLTRTAALDYAPHNIRVNAVCPGIIRTPMADKLSGGSAEVEARYTAAHPMGRLGEINDVVEAILWLCSPASAFVTGHGLVVDGGLTVR